MKVTLKNPRRPDLQPVEVDALADPGSVHLCIPAHIQIQLGLEEVGIKTMCVTFAAYSSQKAPYPIARTVQRKESVIAMCEFIQKKGDVGDAFRAPID